MIEIQTLQRLSQAGDRFDFSMSDSEAYTFAKLARYSLFNVNAELCNPYFSARFWRHCLHIGAHLPASYFESLALELITVSGLSATPIQHLATTWRTADKARVAGAQFTSDLAFLAAANTPMEQKAQLVRQSIGALVPARYDLVAIGFELPPGMKQAAAALSTHEPWQSAAHFSVFRATEEDVARVSAQSLTARLFLTATGCDVACFYLEVRHFVPGTWPFMVFVLSSPSAGADLRSADFWSGALTPLVADSMRTFEFKDLPGQKSRLSERRRAADAAAPAAFNLPSVVQG
jgi:hypothetical protein